MSIIIPAPSASALVALDAGRIAEAVSLDEAAGLLGGEDAWNFPALPAYGLPRIQVADCGHGVTLVAPPYGCATCFPTSTGMAASWDRALLEEVGEALARESQAKGLGMLLAPMVNLHRLPCGGRNYETFSEDPVLTGRLAAAIIRGIQSQGVSACIKSFACNNQQLDQKTTSSDVDPRTLRELYLKVFKIAFAESNPWSVMTSYNPINGERPSDSAFWLQTILRDEMGYDGFVVSDWNAVYGDSAIHSSLDLEMPGPPKVLTRARILAAIRDGSLSEFDLRNRIRRLAELHLRIRPDGAKSIPATGEINTPRHQQLARRVAEQSIVLLQNHHATLPLDRTKLKRIAVVGPNAATARLGGGGSASVSPYYSVSTLAGIREHAGEGIEIVHVEGCPLGDEPACIPPTAFGTGLRADYYSVENFNAGAAPSFSRIDDHINFSWGWAAPADGIPRHEYAVRWSGRINFPDTGEIQLTLSAHEGIARLWIGGHLVLDAWSAYDPDLFEDRYTQRFVSKSIATRAGEDVEIVCEYLKTGTRGAVRLGWVRPNTTDGIEEAVQLAASADAVVLCAGLSNMFEGGNCDRASHAMPGRQEELIRRVAAANPRTIVVLNNGTPVAMSGWRSHVPAILEAFYPGQEGGNAVARILFGDVNPSGRLPDTFPKSWDQVAAMRHYPGTDGHCAYNEGLYVGYRDADANGWEPEFPFGFGLSYTQFHHDTPRLSATRIRSGESLRVSIEITNVGPRAGSEVVQAYLEPVNPTSARPLRELFAFAKVHLAAGEKRLVELCLNHDDLLSYDPELAGWTLETDTFRIAVGSHSRALQKTSFVHTR